MRYLSLWGPVSFSGPAQFQGNHVRRSKVSSQDHRPQGSRHLSDQERPRRQHPVPRQRRRAAGVCYLRISGSCFHKTFSLEISLLIVFPLLQPTSHVLPQDLIVISGYERNVEEARQAIQLLVAELQEMVSQEVHLDPRTHARIIGARGKAIRKLMEEFKVRGCYSLCAPNCRTCSFALFQPLVLVFRWILGSLSQAPTSRIK